MCSLGLFARLEAKPAREKDVAAFLEQGPQTAQQETTAAPAQPLATFAERVISGASEQWI